MTIDELLAQKEAQAQRIMPPPSPAPAPEQPKDALTRLLEQKMAQAGTEPSTPVSPKVEVMPQPLTPQQRAQQRLEDTKAVAEAVRNFTPTPSPMPDIPRLVGGTVGAIAVPAAYGMATGGPPGLLAGAALGALGSAVGEASGKGWERTLQGKAGEAKTRAEMLEAGKGGLTTGLIGGGATVVGAGLVRGGLAAGRMIPGIERMNERLSAAAKNIRYGEPTAEVLDSAGLPKALVERAHKKGTFIPLDQAAPGSLPGRASTFYEQSYGAGRKVADLKRINPAAYKQMMKEYADDMWEQAGGKMTREEVAQMFVSGMEGRRDVWAKTFADNLTKGLKVLPEEAVGPTTDAAVTGSDLAWRKVGGEKYKRIYDLLAAQGKPAEIVADLTPVYAIADKIKDMAEAGRSLGASPGLARIVRKIRGGPPVVSVQDADILRSELLVEGRKIANAIGSRSPRLSAAIRDLQQGLKDSIDTAVGKESPEIVAAFSDARSFWEHNAQLYGNDFVQGLAETAKYEPEKLVDYIFKPKTTIQILWAKEVLGDETFNGLADTWLSRVIEKSLQDPASIGGAMQKQLNKMGKGTLYAMFGENPTEAIYATANMFRREGAKSFENKMIRSALAKAESDPQFIRTIFKPNDTKYAQRYKEILSPEDYDKLGTLWVQDAFQRSGGQVGRDFQKILQAQGEDSLKVMLSPQHYRDLTEIANIGATLGTTETQKWLAPVMEAGAAAGLLTGRPQAIKPAAALLGGGWLIGYVLGNKRAAYWLAQGMKHPEKMQKYSQLITTELVRYRELHRYLPEGLMGETYGPGTLPDLPNKI